MTEWSDFNEQSVLEQVRTNRRNSPGPRLLWSCYKCTDDTWQGVLAEDCGEQVCNAGRREGVCAGERIERVFEIERFGIAGRFGVLGFGDVGAAAGCSERR